MKKPKRQLVRIESEVVEAKALLTLKQAEYARSRNKLKRANLMRVIRTIEDSLDNIRDHRHLLEDQAAGIPRAAKVKSRRVHR